MNRQIAGIKIFWSFVYFLPASYVSLHFIKTKMPCSLKVARHFSIYTNKGDGRNFSRSNKRGICLL
ncbi:hypothetical protein BAVI_20858 [Neobacillus vireti LMG 21834]|uniref:Secreted protein n=1 Tax=Neobacillus vireti LMG 21834 TaxID=1131730 RepID=A0AB94IIA9_9BACI|nr:hypothetical protein BAVI_20858 [Neobacillus vireti LMG 21834]KLT19259.1 hypothetical protein AA980_01225 [Neobacillus vireti]